MSSAVSCISTTLTVAHAVNVRRAEPREAVRHARDRAHLALAVVLAVVVAEHGRPGDLALDHGRGKLAQHAQVVVARLLPVQLVAREHDHVGRLGVERLGEPRHRVRVPGARALVRIEALALCDREVQVGDLEDLEGPVLAKHGRRGGGRDGVAPPEHEVHALPLVLFGLDELAARHALKAKEGRAVAKVRHHLGDVLLPGRALVHEAQLGLARIQARVEVTVGLSPPVDEELGAGRVRHDLEVGDEGHVEAPRAPVVQVEKGQAGAVVHVVVDQHPLALGLVLLGRRLGLAVRQDIGGEDAGHDGELGDWGQLAPPTEGRHSLPDVCLATGSCNVSHVDVALTQTPRGSPTSTSAWVSLPGAICSCLCSSKSMVSHACHPSWSTLAGE
jgi:hypothetical protein